MSTNNNNDNGEKEPKRKRRWGETSSSSNQNDLPPPPSTTDLPPPPVAAAVAAVDGKAKALALQDSIRARLAALKGKAAAAKQAAPAAAAAGVKRPAPAVVVTVDQQQQKKRAKHYDLDLTVTAPTFNEKPAAAKPKINPYLIHRTDEAAKAAKEDATTTATATATATSTTDEASLFPPSSNTDQDESEYVDERLERATKLRKRHKSLKFIEPGTFVEIAERKRLKAANAEQSGFASGRKAGMYFQSSNMANIYGTTEVIEDSEFLAPRVHDKITTPHVLEWWDLELLPTKLKKQVAAYEGKALSKETQSQMQQFATTTTSTTTDNEQQVQLQELQTRCAELAALSYSKTAALIQHIIPIKPPHAKLDKPNVEPTLYLTKRELKRQRKLRRSEKQRELQDLQAAGLVEPPEPRLTLSNFIRVLGDQAFVDPSQMEQRVMEQIQARQNAHMDRNERNKLTKEQKKEKRIKKLQEDVSEQVHVALFYVKDMSHPYHRTKVDLNAQQYNITGGVLECTENPQISCVICEGGPKAIKRYIRLMVVRMKWKGMMMDDEDDEEEDDDDEEDDGIKRHKFNKDNKCDLVWTGMTTKRFFKGFVFQACETSDQASKILRAKGVGHYWDQVLAYASGRGENIPLKLGADSSDDDDDEQQQPEQPEEDDDDEEDEDNDDEDAEMQEP
jgi:U4/U6 small nuclear ribonucleoprotein PRP3